MLRVRVLPGLEGEAGTGGASRGAADFPMARTAHRGGNQGTEDMRRIILFFQESYAELRKVTWPNRDEAVASTKVVLASTIIIAVMLGLVDFILFKLVDLIF